MKYIKQLITDIKGQIDNNTIIVWNFSTRTLKMRRAVASHWKLTMTNWEHHWRLSSYKKLPKNSMSTILQSFGIWSKLERWKHSISGCLMSWVKIKKIVILKYCLLLFYTATMNHCSTGLQRETKNGYYKTTGKDQLSGWTEKRLQSTSRSQTCT